jgi:3-methyladenine DNA glycosylase AlkD
MQAYMKSELPFYGVQKPARTKLARRVFDAHPLESRDEWQRTIQALWRDARHREERYMALALLQDRRYANYRTMDALALCEELIVTGAWWDYVDEVAAGPLGQLLPEATPACASPGRAGSFRWRRSASPRPSIRSR